MEDEVVLPATVERLVEIIREAQEQPALTRDARNRLLKIGEQAAIKILSFISTQEIRTSFSGFVLSLAKRNREVETPAGSSPFTSPLKKQMRRTGIENDNPETTVSFVPSNRLALNCERVDETQSSIVSDQTRILSVLEFRKLFLVLSYMGKNKLENVVAPEAADNIVRIKDYSMRDFESEMWHKYGHKNCRLVDRTQYFDWDSGKTHLYYCYVHGDSSVQFKGPYLDCTRTHLQRSLGDDNILMVKLLEFPQEYIGNIGNKENIDALMRVISNIGNDGIIVGLRRFRFLGYKDDRQKATKNRKDKGKNATCFAKGYFVRIGSLDSRVEDKDYILYGKTIHDARRLFMHIENVPTLEKFMARFSLIMSKTIKLPVDLNDARIVTVDDEPFKDENGCAVVDPDGNIPVHTDGTGFISEDLAMKCPEDFSAAKYIKDTRFEHLGSLKEVSVQRRGARARYNEPPLLMQCRLFDNGRAVKGTLLVNKTLEPGTIHIRPSMIKVHPDKESPKGTTFNSLEIVAVSQKPGRTALARHLIALLSYGGVPQKFFLDLLTTALEDTQNVYYDRRAALKIAANNDGLDYAQIAEMMLSSGMPLDEPYLQHCMSYLKEDGKTKLKEGRIPIGDTFYLMGTADPTGLLENDEVCVILSTGQLSGEVLVYRNPGLHFGDVHRMRAIYKEEIARVVGNSKYGIFFSTKGRSSAAYEMATGDFDGDMYWVSRNSELLKDFRESDPWTPPELSKGGSNSREVPRDPIQLERALYQMFLGANTSSYTMAKATHSWMSYMDRLLTLGESCGCEKDEVKEKMIKLINIYYDALDAPKTGKKVKIDSELEAEEYPHYMEKGHASFKSTSVLGQIYDRVVASQSDNMPEQDIWKLPCFENPEFQKSPEYVECFHMWKERYDEFRKSMADACKLGQDLTKVAANDIIKKYKELLYEAEEMEDSSKDTQRIYLEAMAIYHVNYDYAMSCSGNYKYKISKCNFAWRIAGYALCNFYAWKTASPKERPILILPSVVREVL